MNAPYSFLTRGLGFAPSCRRCLRAAGICLGLLSAGLPGLLEGAPKAETLVEFANGAALPAAALTQGASGDFYGTTEQGGTSNCGTVFRITPAGVRTTLVNFTGNGATNRGSRPQGSLLLGPDGNFYGTTYYGGAGGSGTIFRMTPAGGLTTVVDFTGQSGANRGANPASELLLGADGNFYGVTVSGGLAASGSFPGPYDPGNYGTVFRLTPDGVLTTLVEFTYNTGTNRGAYPYGGLALGPDGNFYGTTSAGGSSYGTAFRMTPGGVLTTLANFGFSGPPYGTLALAPDGNFYGTTYGGSNSYGTVFRLTPAGALTTLVNFTGTSGTNRGANPRAGLAVGADGALYGTTRNGGTGGDGTVFRITTAGALATLVDFVYDSTAAVGAQPYAGLVLGTDGNFYGTTRQGGASVHGTVFRMTPAGALTTLADFSADVDTTSLVRGRQPFASMILGTDGNLYGTTYGGGTRGHGTVFRLSTAGTLTTLVDFSDNGAANRGSRIYASLIQGTDGNFYGTTFEGGATEGGTVFRMTPAGALTTLVEFTGNGATNRGAAPYAGLTLGADGDLYGTTYGGGTIGQGTVFRMTPAGALTTLADFSYNGATAPGQQLYAGLALGADGNFYGATASGGRFPGGINSYGTIFRITPAGAVTTLADFTGANGTNRGSYPFATLVRGADGNFYGTTAYSDSVNGSGTVFRVTPDGALTTLVEFTGNGGANRGSYSQASLALGPDGNFYGTTVSGGANGRGTVFRMTPAGALTTLVDFAGAGGASGGGYPHAGLVLGPDGNFYGTTSGEGYDIGGGNGAVFRLRFGPSPATAPASALLPTDATLNGTVNPNGAATAVFFEHGASPTALTGVTAVQNIPAGSGPVAVSASLSGLVEGRIYYFRLRAENAEQFQPQRGAVLAFVAGAGSASNLVDIAAAAGGQRIRWRGIAGRSYQIQCTNTLSSPWQSLADNVVAGTDGIIEYLDATQPRPAERFYRTAFAPTSTRE